MHASPLPVDALALGALCDALAALDEARSQPGAYAVSDALARVACCYRAAGAHRSAEACLEAALPWARATACVDHLIDLMCSLCETAERVATQEEAGCRGGGRPARERACGHGFDAAALAGSVSDPIVEARALLRIGDVLERCGDRTRAALLETRALQLMSGKASGDADPNLMPGLGRLADG